MRQELGRAHERKIGTHKGLQHGVSGTSYSSCGKLKASMLFSQHRRKTCLSEKAIQALGKQVQLAKREALSSAKLQHRSQRAIGIALRSEVLHHPD